MTKGLDIQKMLTVSTAHIKPETGERLADDDFIDKNNASICFEKREYGWFIYTGCGTIDEYGFEDLNVLIRLAQDNGCDYLCLDSGGMTVEGIPVYEW